jgi:hypothetical protein
MVVGEIIKWMKSVQRQEDLFFYRTRSGLEMDLLLPTSRGIIGMEIKARKTLAHTDLRAMREVAAALGKTWRGGLVIYLGDSLKKIAEPNIWSVPSRRLLTPAESHSPPAGKKNVKEKGRTDSPQRFRKIPGTKG